MPPKIVLYIFSEQTARARSFAFSRSRILILLGVLAAGIAGMVSIFLDHGNIRQVQDLTLQMEQQSALQQAEIEKQRQQIGFFSNEISRLNSQLLALTHLKDEIKTVANISPPSGSENLFGIGGEALEEMEGPDERPRSAATRKAAAARGR